MEKEIRLSDVKDGEVFKVAGMEFIKFPAKDGEVPAVMKDVAFTSKFGDDNDLRSSVALKRMEKEIFPKIANAVGEENVCTIRTDLTTLCGLKDYGVMESRISLPTLDFYRENTNIFAKHPVKTWWWLATPETVLPRNDPFWTLCVTPAGFINYFNCGGDSIGVRLFCIFKSSIFVSQ